MAYRYTNKTCANCLHKQEMLEYYSDGEKDDYNEFLSYANFELEQCEECGYVSSDITQNPQDLKAVQNTKEYLTAKNYGYIDGALLEEYDYIFESYSANEYEAYAVHQKQNNNIKEYTRAMFSSIMQTLAIINTLEHELDMEGDDLDPKEIDDYKAIKKVLTEEVNKKCEKIVKENYRNSTNDQIIYLICLKKIDMHSFEREFKSAKSKFSDKLQKFILEY